MNGKKLGYIAKEAIAHMIGQTEDIFNRGATVAEIAAWLCVSKPTAKRFLDIELSDILGKETHVWRNGHSIQYRYVLDGHSRMKYERGYYYKSYKSYVSLMHKISEMA